MRVMQNGYFELKIWVSVSKHVFCPENDHFRKKLGFGRDRLYV